MKRYLHLLWLALRTSLLVSLQYRWDFVLQGLMQVVWMGLSTIPLLVAYQARAGATATAMSAADIGGWGFYPAMMVFSFFLLLKAILEGAINPSLSAVVEHIRKGTLDFMLLKPADAQFLVSTARFEPWHLVDALASLALLGYGVVKNSQAVGGALPGPGAVGAAAVLFGCAVVILYSIWILVVCAAFYVVKVDNLSFLFTSVFDFARWPRSVFRGGLLVLFTYVIPLVMMTSLPADALLGQLSLLPALAAVAVTGVMAVGSRRVWRGAIASYTSASS